MEQFSNNRPPRPNQRLKVQGLTGMVMGVVYIFMGILFLSAKEGKFLNLELNSTVSYAIGGIAILYGTFRIWRGYQMRKRA